jgi:hypothetical protein
MSIAVLFMMPEREIVFFGVFLSGKESMIIVLLLDCISPLVFIFSAWKKLKWGANFGMIYNGVFILNNVVALFLFRDVFGNGIYFPLILSTIFFYIIYINRKYFSE